jgi:hypothetical protein
MQKTRVKLLNYFKGVEWYLSLFSPPVANKSAQIYFEKSANYFTESKTPNRIKKLIANPKFVIITIDPVDRAYRWYQVTHFYSKTSL